MEKLHRRVFRYEMSYTRVSPGLRRLYVPVSDASGSHVLHILRMREYVHSQYPFTVTVCSDPTRLSHPVKVISDLQGPYGIAFNSHGEMVVSEYWEDQLSVLNIRGKKIRTIRSHDDCPGQIVYPKGIAIDDRDNIYVSSECKLQKFTRSGEMVECVRQYRHCDGIERGLDPRGVTLYNNQVYVCDGNNHLILVFDMDLNFVRSIGSHGKGRGEFHAPEDIKFDASGNMYITDTGNYRVQVLNSNGHFLHFLQVLGETIGSLHIIDKYVYGSDNDHRIVVYKISGEFVTSFGDEGREEGEFRFPASITSCANGYIYVCDWYNDRVQVF